MNAFTKLVYGVLGAIALAAGIVALFMPEIALPPAMTMPMARHLVREQASAFVFIGLMFFWCLTHYAQRRPVHWALLIFVTIFAGVHWLDYVAGRSGPFYPLINTIPVALIALTAPWTRLS